MPDEELQKYTVMAVSHKLKQTLIENARAKAMEVPVIDVRGINGHQCVPW